jgi:uncharacterized protein (TIGR02118 family)
MVKMVFCLQRLPGISAAEFSTYWRDRHAAVFQQYAAALRVTRYTQSHRLAVPLNAALRSARSAPDGFDGVAEVWFESIEDLMQGLLSDAGRAAGAALIEDERQFIDHANSPIWVADEVEIDLGGPGASLP